MTNQPSLKQSPYSLLHDLHPVLLDNRSSLSLGDQSNGDFNSQTWRFYQNCAEVYDNLYPDHLTYSRQLFMLLLPVLREHGVQKVLDASCGVGHDMSCLLQHGLAVDGLDISEAMLRQANMRLSAKGFDSFSLFSGDVRLLNDLAIPNTYDMVLFRGNTLSNIRPFEWNRTIEQLVKIIRPGGLLCIDYRNGEKLYRQKRFFEFRGAGYNKCSKQFFVSFYIVRHARSIQLPYRVRAVVLQFGRNINFVQFQIHSHYVVSGQIESLVKNYGCKLLPMSSEWISQGLPCLETLIAVKE